MAEGVFSEILGRTDALDRPALLGPQACSHGDLLRLVDELSRRLAAHRFGSRKILAAALPNSREHIVTLLAARSAGLVFLPLNPRATPAEKLHVLRDSAAALFVTTGDDRVFAESTGARMLEQIGSLSIYGMPETAGPSLEPEDSVVIYTSGSTSGPKGVVHTDASISANVRAVAEYLALTPDDRCPVFTPPSFAYAISQILTHLWAGGAVLPSSQALLQPGEFLRSTSKAGVTGFQANPTIFEMLLSADDQSWPSFPSVRYLMSGGQPLTSDLVRRLKARFGGARVVSMYGCTENAPRVSYYWLPDSVSDRKTPWPVGRAIAGTRIRVVGSDGSEVAGGTVGEILVGGTSLMRGYLSAPEGLAGRIENGWFKTRDLGFIDGDGELNLVGRLDSVFSVGHEKIVPEEIEDLIGRLPGVRDVAVAPIADRILSQIPAALIVADGDFADVAARVRAACGASLARAKFPRRIFHVSAVPRTSYGKIDRAGVRELAARLAGEKE